MGRVPLSDETPDPTDDSDQPFLEDTEFDGHYEELDFEDDPWGDYDEDDDAADPMEDEQDYGRDNEEAPL